MEICKSCGSEYDTDNVVIPSPIPDYMCAECGTQLVKEQVEELISKRLQGN